MNLKVEQADIESFKTDALIVNLFNGVTMRVVQPARLMPRLAARLAM